MTGEGGGGRGRGGEGRGGEEEKVKVIYREHGKSE